MNNEREVKSNVFSNKNFLLVFLGSLISDLGSVIYNFVVSFYILEISNNNALLQGVYLAVGSAVLLIFLLVGGVMCDRYNKARIMYIADFIKGLCILISAIGMMLLPDKSAHIVLLFIIGFMGNIAHGLFSPASTALLPHIVDDQLLQQANAILSIKSSVQSVLGVVLAGILYSVFSPTVLFVIVGICYILSGISEMFVRYEDTPAEGQLTLRVMREDMKSGWFYLKGQKAMLVLVMAVLFINFFFTPFTGNFMSYFVKTDLSEASSYLFDSFLDPEMWLSVVSVVLSIATLIGAAVIAIMPQKEKCGRDMVISLSVAAAALVVITADYRFDVAKGLSINRFLIILSLCCFVIGIAIMFINIPVSTTLMRMVDEDKLGKVSSITSVASQALIPLSSVLAGIILQYMGTTVLLVFCSAGFVRTVLILLSSKETANI